MVILKSEEEIRCMAKASKLVADGLTMLKSMVCPGVLPVDLDSAAEDFIRTRGGIPAFKGYRGFPATLCVSVNDQVVHGIPLRRPLEKGDIVGLDLGAIVEGFYGDSAVTVAVGTISDDAQRLISVTEESLHQGIAKAVVGNRLSDISHAIQTYVEEAGFSIVREFVGHGIGRDLHEDPQIPNYGLPGQGPRLRKGMVLAIEPMVNEGAPDVRVLDDQWTAVTKDGSFSAHFEHTLVVMNGQPTILTQSS
tara:strand:- start:436 stop:1185 length:750 start_codon:yes stop_codon:yes gene_type:complete